MKTASLKEKKQIQNLEIPVAIVVKIERKEAYLKNHNSNIKKKEKKS